VCVTSLGSSDWAVCQAQSFINIPDFPQSQVLVPVFALTSLELINTLLSTTFKAAGTEKCSKLSPITITLSPSPIFLTAPPLMKLAWVCLTYLNSQQVKNLSSYPLPDHQIMPLLKYSSRYWNTCWQGTFRPREDSCTRALESVRRQCVSSITLKAGIASKICRRHWCFPRFLWITFRVFLRDYWNCGCVGGCERLRG